MFTQLRKILLLTIFTLLIAACSATTDNPDAEPPAANGNNTNTGNPVSPDELAPPPNDAAVSGMVDDNNQPPAPNEGAPPTNDAAVSGMVDSSFNPLLSTEWLLSAMITADGPQKIPYEVTLLMPEGTKLNGNSGCNSYSAQFTHENGSITINPIMQTMMACFEDDRMLLESTYTAALQTAHSYTIDNDTLTILTADGQLVFTRIIPPPPASLTNTVWQLHTLTAADAARSLFAGTVVHLIFNEDGTASGFATCNNFATSYTVEDDQLQFAPIAGQLALCANEDYNQQESEFLAALGQATSHRIDGNQLTIIHPDGTLQFSAQPALTAEPFLNTNWQLTSWIHQGEWRDIVGQEPLTAVFTADQINGTTGCNNFFGSYTTNNGTLTTDILATTRRACLDDAAMAQETDFTTALGQTTHHIQLDAETLTLFTPNNTFFFNPAP
ncbi:MAG TPA: META domain-containing protein [Anaerolineae bacterium]|nr:META domain-containing protein [Anaerolineae bacterium]